jgi:hypothetical protein
MAVLIGLVARLVPILQDADAFVLKYESVLVRIREEGILSKGSERHQGDKNGCKRAEHASSYGV